MSEKESDLKLITQEWPFFLSVDEIGTKPMRLMNLSPDEAQIKAITKRLELLSLDFLSADLVIERSAGSMVIHVKAMIRASVKQRCIVSLEPVSETISEECEGWFADPHQAVSFTKAKRQRLSLQEQMELPMLDENEDPEPIIDGKIDLGEFIVQHFSLSLNPYPRRAGFDYENSTIHSDPEPEGMYDNPFAALKEWKEREKKKEKP